MSLDWDIVPPPTALSTEAAALMAAASRLPEERFAVLDGALFDDLAGELSTHGLTARPLFLEAGGPAAVASGPFLLALLAPADIERLMICHRGRRSPVFWSWPAGEAALFRHLRMLNLTEIPDENRESDEAPAYDTVIFRHWDAVALGQTLPLLRPGQIARFLGPGAGLAFDAGLGGGLNQRMRPAALPAPETGMLRLSAEQMTALKARRMHGSRLKVLRYLEEVDPESVEGLEPQGRFQRVIDYERSGNALGLVSERAHMKWAYLMSISEGGIASDSETYAFFQSRPEHPDQAIDLLLDLLDQSWPVVGA